MDFSAYQHLPNVDGEGFLFAFSGMDGATSYAANFVLARHRTNRDFLIQTEFLHQLCIRCAGEGKLLAAAGDVYAVEFGGAQLLLTFSAWHTLIGQIPADTSIALLQDGSEVNLSVCNAQDAMLNLAVDGKRFALAYGSTGPEARSRAQAGLQADMEKTITDRLAIYRQLGPLIDGSADRLLGKCFSVMKVNAMSAEGDFKQHWSTPDRVPHRDMWLWDSVFHSLAMNKVNAPLAWEYLKTVLDQQSEDGMIAHQFRPTGWHSAITQPPILAWGVWENFLHNPDQKNLAYAADRLSASLNWDLEHRDQNRNGLLEWFIEENENCRSGESGMDNSQRFDEALLLDAVDFSAFAALDMGYLAKIYAQLGEEKRAAAWQNQAQHTSDALHRTLWDDQTGFYLDRKLNGAFSPVQAVTGFLPLLLDDFPAERLPQMVDALQDETRFHTAFPLPSVARSTPAFSTDMWRGAVWVNLNYLAAMGFAKQGRIDLAKSIRVKTIAMVRKYYEQTGVIYEFYDALDQRPPYACDRKGACQPEYDIRRKMDSIRDYHWSAALTFLMLLETSETLPLQRLPN